MLIEEEMRGSVLSLENFNNISIKLQEVDSERRLRRVDSRAVY
jgi:hypothetical protein